MTLLCATTIESAERGGAARRASAVSITAFSLAYQNRQVLDSIDLDIPNGQFIALIGPSGSGKSTLLNAIAGFLTATSPGVAMHGNVRVGGRQPDQHGIRCGVVFQEYALFPWRTARRNVEFALEALGVPAADRERRAMCYLSQVGLAAAATLYPHQLSGGMRQRVAIARALAYQPGVLLMDEPLGALDAITRGKLMVLIDQVWSNTQTTVVYVTHNVGEAVYLADRVVVLKTNPGKIVLDLTIDLARPRQLSSQQFIDLERRLHAAIPESERDDESS